jgi:oligoribonuclease NrnB/cAMP/cGMP phosphodiesterase (DHH superfamily)
MFPLEKLLAVKKIVSHENCPDGMASAILLHDVLPNAEIVFMQYQTVHQKELNPEPGMLFVDFSPHESRFREFVEAGALVLDHHKTAAPIVEAFGKNGVFGNEVDEPGVCGAVLAYRHVWEPLTRAGRDPNDSNLGGLLLRAEAFATLAGVRDTWQNKSPDWRKACIQAEMLRFYPAENWLSVFNPFRYENNSFWAERTKLGQLIVEKHEIAVKKSIEKAYRFTTAKGTRVIMLSNTHTTSDAAEALGSEVDLVVGFGFEVDGGTPKVFFSTRSRGEFDCGTFCKSLGGGGHTKAAGFNRPLTIGTSLEPYSFLKNILEAYE